MSRCWTHTENSKIEKVKKQMCIETIYLFFEHFSNSITFSPEVNQVNFTQ